MLATDTGTRSVTFSFSNGAIAQSVVMIPSPSTAVVLQVCEKLKVISYMEGEQRHTVVPICALEEPLSTTSSSNIAWRHCDLPKNAKHRLFFLLILWPTNASVSWNCSTIAPITSLSRDLPSRELARLLGDVNSPLCYSSVRHEAIQNACVEHFPTKHDPSSNFLQAPKVANHRNTAQDGCRVVTSQICASQWTIHTSDLSRAGLASG